MKFDIITDFILLPFMIPFYASWYYRSYRLQKEQARYLLSSATKDEEEAPFCSAYGVDWGYKAPQEVTQSLSTGDLLYFSYAPKFSLSVK